MATAAQQRRWRAKCTEEQKVRQREYARARYRRLHPRHEQQATSLSQERRFALADQRALGGWNRWELMVASSEIQP